MLTAQKMKFSITICSINVTKSAVSCGFGYIEEIRDGKLHSLWSRGIKRSLMKSEGLPDAKVGILR